MRRNIALLPFFILLPACSLMQSEYTTPDYPLPATYVTGAIETASISSRWWTSFNDANLNLWIEEVLAHNNDLAAAALRVRQAQLQAGLAADDLTPALSAGLSTNTSRSTGQNDQPDSTYSASAGVSYELDLWNKLAASRDAARWEATATAEDREATRLTLITTVLNLYWQIGYLNARIAYGQQSVSNAERTLQLAEATHKAGAASGLDTAEATQSLETQRSSLLTLQQQLTETRNALALLTNGVLPDLPLPQSLGDAPLPNVAPGLPAQLLGQRPDLRAAELRLRSSLNNVDVAQASFYPGFSLTGSLGASGSGLLAALQNPVAALGAGLTLPFIEWNRLEINRDVTQAQYEEAIINFRQSLATALTEVNNALTARQTYLKQYQSLINSRQAAATATRIYQAQYREGAVDLRTRLDAEERLRNADISLLDNRKNLLNAQATLYAALGGGTGE